MRRLRQSVIISFVFLSLICSLVGGWAVPLAQAQVPGAIAWHELKDDPKLTNAAQNKRYLDVLHSFLSEAVGAKTEIYIDAAGQPSIGLGYNLTNLSVRNKVLTAFGINPQTAKTAEQRATLETAVAAITNAVDNFAKPKPPAKLIPGVDSTKFGYGQNKDLLQADLNTIVADLKNNRYVQTHQSLPRSAQLPLTAVAVIRPAFSFDSQVAAADRSLFYDVHNLLGVDAEIDREVKLPPSLERVALASLIYDNIHLRDKQGQPTSLLKSVQAGNRGQAWYEIRYASLLNGVPEPSNKLPSELTNAARRRNFESDLFGLYNGDPYGSQASMAEAASVYTLLNDHRDQIYRLIDVVDSDEIANRAKQDFSATTTKINSFGFANFVARSRDESIQPSADFFLSTRLKFGSQTGITILNQIGQSVPVSFSLSQASKTNQTVFLQANCPANQELELDNANNLVYAAGNALIKLGSGLNQLRLSGSNYTVEANGLKLSERRNLAASTIKHNNRSVATNLTASTQIINGWKYQFNAQARTLRITSPTLSLTINGFTSGDFGIKVTTASRPLTVAQTLGLASPLAAPWRSPGSAAPLNCPLPKLTRQTVFRGTSSNNQAGLWVTDGTVAGTAALRLIPAYGTEPVPQKLTKFGSKALFSGVGQDKLTQLWLTDGTVGGTKQLTSQTATDESRTVYGVSPNDITPIGAKAVFSGFNDLWVTDGTVSGTHRLSAIAGAASPMMPTNIASIGNRAVFNALDDKNRQRLWVTDGTVSGTHVLNITGASQSFTPSQVTTFSSGRALLRGTDYNNRAQLWVTDGTTIGSKQLTNLVGQNGQGVEPLAITVFGGQAIFNGYDQKGRRQLWLTNGTLAGTHLVEGIKNLPPGGLGPTTAVVVMGRVIFSTTDPTSNKSSLWRTDGTAGGTDKLTDLSAGASVAASFGNQAIFNDSKFYGSGSAWITDGTSSGTHAISNLIIYEVASFGNLALISGNLIGQPRQLLVSDGQQITQLTDDEHGVLMARGYGVEPSMLTILKDGNN